MNYSNQLDKLLKVNLFGGMKLGLHNPEKLNALLNFPDRKFQSIHIAGTNGKGSVSTKIAKGLERAGYRVGLYTSPHISCFRERIKINGEMISEEVSAKILNRLFDIAEKEGLHPTFFEYATLLAFQYFGEEKVDIAVLETGLGGRLDATNIVVPKLSVITSISLEHTEILGSTIEKIAEEKAGIIKPSVPVVIGPRANNKIINQIAKERESHLEIVQGNFKTFDEENSAIARKALELLNIPREAIFKGITALPACRMEILEVNSKKENQIISTRVILDVAHNPDGLFRLFESLRHKYPLENFRILFGLSKTKDIDGCLAILAKNGSHFHLVEASNGRGLSAKDLAVSMEKLGIPSQRFSINGGIKESVRIALEEASKKQEMLIICGTFFIMGEVRHALEINEPCDSFDMNEKKV